jgi:hypothetical protein
MFLKNRTALAEHQNYRDVLQKRNLNTLLNVFSYLILIRPTENLSLSALLKALPNNGCLLAVA